MLVSNAHQQWCIEDPFGDVAFDVELNRDPPQIEFSIRLPEETKILLFSASDFEGYLCALKAFFLLCRATALLSNNYVVAKLTGTPLTIQGGRG